MARGRKKKQVETEEQQLQVEEQETTTQQEEIILTLAELINSDKATVFRKHTKDFAEKNVDGDFIDLYETELLLVTIPLESIKRIELLPNQTLLLRLEKYDRDKYIIEPRSKTSILRLYLNKPFVKIIVGG